jgi:hypothetical protein
MNRFITNHADKIKGVLHGFDRLVFRGNLRQIAYVNGLVFWFWKRRVLLKEFGSFAQGLSDRLKEASCRRALAVGRPVQYLQSSKTDKEAIARKIATKDKITEGLIAVLTCVEPCNSFDIFRNRERHRLELVPRLRKGLALYHYFIDPIFGFMQARIQSWLPFGIQVCLNGREWLSREMDRARLTYRRRDNCFVDLENIERAQQLMQRQLALAWPSALRRIARQLNPEHRAIFRNFPIDYYWSVYQSEWATDIMFQNSATLTKIYPALVQHGITSFSSPKVMRFLGGKVHGAFRGEIVSDFKDRPEGVCLKHRVGANSVKVYDKQGSVLRVETTINQPTGLKVFRRAEGVTTGKRTWRPMRKGVADIQRRAKLSQSANERYLDALASANTATQMGELTREICRPTMWKNTRVRALRPWSPEDTQLFKAIGHGEFTINGFRNRDLQSLLYTTPAESPAEKKRRSARVTRQLRMLRAHGLIKKINSTHRYILTVKGRDIVTAILTAQRINLQQLQKAAA